MISPFEAPSTAHLFVIGYVEFGCEQHDDGDDGGENNKYPSRQLHAALWATTTTTTTTTKPASAGEECTARGFCFGVAGECAVGGTLGGCRPAFESVPRSALEREGPE